MKTTLDKTLFSIFYVLIFISAIGRIQYSATTVSLWINIYRLSVYLIILIGVIYVIYAHRIVHNKQINILALMVFFELAVTLFSYSYFNITLLNEAVIDLAAWPFVFILTYNFACNTEVPKSFKKITILGCAIIVGITGYNISKMGSIGVNPAVGGVSYCVALLPLIFMSFSRRNARIATAIILFIVMMSTKRTSFLALLLGIFMYLISDALIQEMPRKKFNKMIGLMSLVVIAVIVGIYMIEQSDLEIIREFASGDETMSGRTLLWNRILAYFDNQDSVRKFLGNGMHAVKYKINPYGLGWFAHNSFIETLYDYGVVGLIILVSFLVLIIKKCIEINKRKSKVAPIISYTIPPMLLFAFASYFFEIGQSILLYSFVWSFCLALYDNGRELEIV